MDGVPSLLPGVHGLRHGEVEVLTLVAQATGSARCYAASEWLPVTANWFLPRALA